VDPTPAEIDARVLIFAPVGRDAVLTRDLLARAGISAEICPSTEALCAEVRRGAAAVVLTEEVFEQGGFPQIAASLQAQPPWSDIPVLLFAGSEGQRAPASALGVIDQLPNVTLLDRPIRVSVALSIIRASLRARRRQLELRNLLVALEQSREQAETANRLKDEFLATLSHELRTPLNAILGWAAILRNGGLDAAKMKRGLEVIDRNAHAQAQLVEDVLDMARVITGKLRVDLKPEPLAAIVDAAVQALRPAADAKRITLHLARVAEGVTIRGDADRLQQVFWNLISNAVKFTPDGGFVTVRVERSSTHVTVSVTDSGIGMDPQFMPMVFDRFRQADQTVTRGHGGLGLGLSIVKHLVELHGGTVSASSPGPGAGSTFAVILPIPTIVGSDADLHRQPPLFSVALPGRAVLVVDHDAATRAVLADVFAASSAAVRTADTVAAALASARAEPPDVVIADLSLPPDGGLSLIRRLRSLPPPAGEVPAIALSAYTRAEDRTAALTSGFTEFMSKPASPHELLLLVERLLESR
jgi:signal transduction histidine kinase/CheY-like chemotaxis protein